MHLYYSKEHFSCINYKTDFSTGFKHKQLAQGSEYETDKTMEHHLVFLIEGQVLIDCNEFHNKHFSAGEILFIPQFSMLRAKILEHMECVVFSYLTPQDLCQKFAMERLYQYAKNIEYNFSSLRIKKIVYIFLTLLNSYLSKQINCFHLHEIKQQELFLLFRTHYSKNELARFFLPMLGKNLDFRSLILKNYAKAKTVKELANICGISPMTFQRRFKEEFKESPYQWLQKERGKIIREKLLDRTIPIKEIIADFDFSSPSHLTIYCKRVFNQTPSEIRKTMLE